MEIVAICAKEQPIPPVDKFNNDLEPGILITKSSNNIMSNLTNFLAPTNETNTANSTVSYTTNMTEISTASSLFIEPISFRPSSIDLTTPLISKAAIVLGFHYGIFISLISVFILIQV